MPKTDGMSREELGKRIYANLSASEALEGIARCLWRELQPDGRYTDLLDKCIKASIAARQDADKAMHELGIGYYQIYVKTPEEKTTLPSLEGKEKSEVFDEMLNQLECVLKCIEIDGTVLGDMAKMRAVIAKAKPFCKITSVDAKGGGE